KRLPVPPLTGVGGFHLGSRRRRSQASTDQREPDGDRHSTSAMTGAIFETVNALIRSASATYASSAANTPLVQRVNAPAAVARPDMTSASATVHAAHAGSPARLAGCRQSSDSAGTRKPVDAS